MDQVKKDKALLAPLTLVPKFELASGYLDVDEDQNLLVYRVPEVTTLREACDVFRPDPEGYSDKMHHLFRDLDQKAKNTTQLEALPSDTFLEDQGDPQNTSSMMNQCPSPRMIIIDGPAPQKPLQLTPLQRHFQALVLPEIQAEILSREKSNRRKIPQDIPQLNVREAFDRHRVLAQHQDWVKVHLLRLSNAPISRNAQHQALTERILASTSQHRNARRLARLAFAVQQRAYQQLLVALVAVAFVSPICRQRLLRHWQEKAAKIQLGQMVKRWKSGAHVRHERRERADEIVLPFLRAVKNQTTSTLLIVALRKYLRRVRMIQRHWRAKVAGRLAKMEIVVMLWHRYEAQLKEEHEQQQQQRALENASKAASAKKKGKHTKVRKRLAKVKKEKVVMTTLPNPVPRVIRDGVILAYYLEERQKFDERKEAFLAEWWPQLIQIIYEELENTTREGARKIAEGYRALGLVEQVFQKYHVCADESFPTFRLVDVPIETLVKLGQARHQEQLNGSQKHL